MASILPFLPSMLIFLLVLSAAIANATSSVVNKDIVPCTMCVECENPCQPLPPPPPPAVIECPPPPPPPKPSPPPPSPPLPPAVVECPPPPKPSSTCQNCELPHGPPYPQQAYYPPGTPFPYNVPPYYVRNSGGKVMPFQALLFSNMSSFSVYSICTALFVGFSFFAFHIYLFNLIR